MKIDGIMVYEVNIHNVPDKTPIYIEFEGNNSLQSQWGVVDAQHKTTIHKDFTINFSDKVKYYSPTEMEPIEAGQSVIRTIKKKAVN